MSLFFATLARRRSFSFLVLTVLLTFISQETPARAQPPADPLSTQPQDRITSFVDDDQLVALRGNRHPLAIAQYDTGAVAPDYPMEHMLLTLLPGAAQQDALNQLVEAQHNPESPYYHQWLTPEQYAERFGVSEGDVAKIAAWLQSHGMEVEEVTAARRSIVFTGTASQVESAFHTQIHTYKIGGEVHHANASDPEIPAAFARVVGGVVSLHDFRSAATHRPAAIPTPATTYGSSYYLSPADFATIYDLDPLYQASIGGSGESVAIVARSNINIADVRQFRTSFGLPANDPQIIVNGTDPGIWSTDEETEADLDVEWSGAVARNATVQFVVSKSTNSSDGTYLSAQYIVNHNLAPAMSMSFGLCEAALGSSGNSFISSLWEQAASQGITVFVSSGDNGAAGCDSASASTATHGRAVNGLCSTPYSVCVGGTEFNDTAHPSLYWSSSNTAGTQASALSYIPEVVWNESGSGGLWASGGGASTIYAKPSWQAGTGVPADGKRDVPDVALTAAGHDGYLIYQNGGLYVVGGTSAASPSFAGIMALVVQHNGARQGNASTVFYPLATKQGTGGASVFHDITIGNNSVPGQTGFNAMVGYDQATGLGSVDASVLVNHWSDGVIVPAFQVTPSSSSISVTTGSNNSVTLNVTVSGGFKAAVAFSITGLPTGVTGAFTPATIASPGSGSSVLKLTAASSAKVGVYSATVSAASGSTTHQVSLSVTIAPSPTFTLAPSATSISVPAGSSKAVTFTTTANSTFNAAVTLTASGLPTGLTVAFSPSHIVTAPGSGATTVTFSAASSLAPKAYSVSVSATGGGVTQNQTLTVNVPGFSLTPSATSVTVSSTAHATLNITTAALGGFSSSVALSVSGLPTGITASFSPQTVASPGSGSSTLTLAKGSGPTTGSSSFTVKATGTSFTQSTSIGLTVK
ncbi:MAG: protease pro-enzyme activation domain-containing protein [Candidatus Sulfotelmatobacter sp.]